MSNSATPRYVYLASDDVFVILHGVDSKSRATIEHPATGYATVSASDLREATARDIADLPPIAPDFRAIDRAADVLLAFRDASFPNGRLSRVAVFSALSVMFPDTSEDVLASRVAVATIAAASTADLLKVR